MAIFADLQYYLCWRRWVGLKKPKICWRNMYFLNGPYSIHKEMKHFLKYFSHISESGFSQYFSSILCHELFNIFCIKKIFLRHLKIYLKSIKIQFVIQSISIAEFIGLIWWINYKIAKETCVLTSNTILQWLF